MHAHRCQSCARQGVNTVWIHGEDAFNCQKAHTCPKCGAVEWEKWLVPLGKLPKAVQGHGGAVQVIQLHEMIFVMALFVCLIILGFEIAKLWKKSKAAV